MQINLKEGVNPKADVRGSDVSFQPQYEKSTVAQAGPTTGETFRAANLKYNPLGSAFDSIIYHSLMDQYEGPLEDDDDYSPFDEEELNLIDGYDPQLFIDSKSRQETLRVMEMNERDKWVNQTLADSGAMGVVASVAAGFTNPLYMVPVLGWGRGLGAGRRFLAAAAMGGGIEGANELLLHRLDSERTLDESAYAVTAGALFSGILGSVIRNPGALPDELVPDVDFVGPRLAKEFGDADKVYKSLRELEDVDQLTGPSAKLSRLTPLRILASPVSSVRKLAAALGEQNVVTTARAAVETAIKRFDGMLVPGIKVARQQYRAMKRAGAGRMNYQQFQEEVAFALRNGDQHPNQYVQTAAQSYRKNILKPMFDEAVQAGLLSADHATKFAASYFPRMYNFGKIKAFSDEFIDDVAKWVRNDSGLSVDDSLDAAREVYRQIINHGTGVEIKTAFVVPKAGPLKARELAIPDNVLSKYLVNDPDSVLKFYARDMGVDLELTRRFGDTELDTFRKEIERDWTKYIEQNATDPHTTAKLNRQMADDIEVIGALLDRLKGKYKMPVNPDSMWVRVGRQLRNWSVLRNLGGMTISAFPDLARPLYNHGALRWSKGIFKLATDPNLRRMARADTQRLGTALDMTLNQRVRSISEQDFLPYTNSRFESVMERMVAGTPGGNADFGKVSGMSWWNTNLKTLSGVLSQDGLIRALQRNRVKAKELARAGIKDSDGMVQRMKDQIKKHGTKERGLRFANSDMWDDVEAAMIFDGAITREIDSTIVTPGIMDKPLWMSSEMGKVIGSLKSFAFSATNRQLIHSIEQGRRGDFMFLQGVMGATAIGSLSWAIKQKLAGKDLSEITPERLVMEGADQGAVIGFGGEILGFGHDVSIATGAVEDDNISSMWARHSAIDTLMGPALGGIALGLQGSNMVLSDEPTGSDIEAFRRMLPYQNLFYARGAFDRMETFMKDQQGVDR
jgi:hypothetical protein